MKSSKFKKPEELFSYLKEEFGLSVFNDAQKCLAIMIDKFEGDKQVTFQIKTAFNNNVYETLLKAENSTFDNNLIQIEQAVKILTDDCGFAKEKAITAVGWLAGNIYPDEWSCYIKQPNKTVCNSNLDKDVTGCNPNNDKDIIEYSFKEEIKAKDVNTTEDPREKAISIGIGVGAGIGGGLFGFLGGIPCAIVGGLAGPYVYDIYQKASKKFNNVKKDSSNKT